MSLAMPPIGLLGEIYGIGEKLIAAKSTTKRRETLSMLRLAAYFGEVLILSARELASRAEPTLTSDPKALSLAQQSVRALTKCALSVA
jgi:hypothetical protein